MFGSPSTLATMHLIVLAVGLGWGPLFALDAWLRGYELRQSTRLELIPSCPAGRVIGLGNSGLSAPDSAIIGEKLEATEARWLWMECSISYIFCQLRLIHSRSINILKSTALSTLNVLASYLGIQI